MLRELFHEGYETVAELDSEGVLRYVRSTGGVEACWKRSEHRKLQQLQLRRS